VAEFGRRQRKHLGGQSGWTTSHELYDIVPVPSVGNEQLFPHRQIRWRNHKYI